MNHDDELRRRLQDIPTPSAHLDADAVLAGAKRRRRPKTIALSSAATVAGVLLFAPLVAPGITGLRPGTSVSVDSGANPESAPASPDFGGEGGGEEDTDGSDNAQPDSGASAAAPATTEAAPLCGLQRAGELGLVLAFAERPGGATPVQVRVVGDDGARVTTVSIDAFAVSDGVARVEPGESREQIVLEAGETAALTVATATLEPGACGEGTPSAPTPVAIVGVDGAAPIAVAGSPWE
ncbi:hypothetical protein [Agrococcus sp. ProA11]|uniref:hypothetical protein n=1 Tax=Agrococcus chionoecetis TaxID=3153752 RepID=UPI003260982E